MTREANPWKTPQFEEINMSAEIGAYQGDENDGNSPPAPHGRSEPAVSEP